MVVVFAPNPSSASAATLLNCTDPLVGRGRKIEDVASSEGESGKGWSRKEPPLPLP